MQVRLLVERDQDECFVKLAGTTYKFKRNEHGQLVADISDQEHIKWVSDPTHNTSFKLYSPPKEKVVVEEVVDETVDVTAEEAVDDEVPVTDESQSESEMPNDGNVEEAKEEGVPEPELPVPASEPIATVDDEVAGESLPVHEQVGSDAFAPHTGQVDESPVSEPGNNLPPNPKKGSKKTSKKG